MKSVHSTSGSVTFLFTDIERSTRLWAEDPGTMRGDLARHDALLRASIESNHGHVFKTIGDAFCAAFAVPQEAVNAAVEAQRSLCGQLPNVRVRMAVHTGEAEAREGDYFGPALNHVARLLAAGHGGQVLLSRSAAEHTSAGLPPDTELRLLGLHRLRDLPYMEAIYQLQRPDFPVSFPPLNTLDVAFRRGMRRAAAVGTVVAGALATLALAAIRQARRADQNSREARELLARAQLERGVQLLESRDSLGLLDLLQAHRTAADLPQVQASVRAVWAGWHAATDTRLAAVVGHSDSIGALAISPDGRLLATGSFDHTARLWEMPSGQPAGPVMCHGDRVLAVAFSPDGKLLATASADKTVRLWDTATVRPHGRPLSHEASVQALAFSPDGKLLATGSDDKTARLWETASGQPHGLPLRWQQSVGALAFSPDGKLLATGSPNPGVQLWETASGQPHGQEVAGGLGGALAFSPDGSFLAVGTNRFGGPGLLDTATGQICRVMQGHGSGVLAVAFSPVGELVVTGSWDGTARLWQTTTGETRGSPLRHEGTVGAVAFSADGQWVATGSADAAARLWEAASGEPVGPPLRHQGAVQRVAFSPEGKWLATASLDGNARVWEVRAPDPPGRPYARPLTHDFHVRAVTFSPDGKLVATASNDKTARLWQTATGEPYGPPLRHDSVISAVKFSPDGKLVATASDDHTAQLWETATGKPHGPRLRHNLNAWRVAFSPDGKLLATSSWDKTVRLWDTVTGRPHGVPLLHPVQPVDVAFSPGGTLLASTAQDGAVRLWEADPSKGGPGGTWRPARGAAAQPIGILRHSTDVGPLAFSPDGRLLATGSSDGATRVWDTVTRQPWGRPLQHGGNVVGVAFSPDGKLLATAGWFAESARVWELATGQPCGPPLFHPHPARMWSVAFSPDGRLLATSSDDHTARLWRLPSPPRSAREMELRTWVALGMRLNAQGSVEAIPWQEWRRLREELQALESERER